MGNALKACSKVDSITIVYEDVALHPKKQFPRLFEYINVMSPSVFDSILVEYSESSLTNWHPYTIRRTSRDEIEKWRQNLEMEQINAIMKGYMRSGLQYYRERENWTDK